MICTLYTSQSCIYKQALSDILHMIKPRMPSQGRKNNWCNTHISLCTCDHLQLCAQNSIRSSHLRITEHILHLNWRFFHCFSDKPTFPDAPTSLFGKEYRVPMSSKKHFSTQSQKLHRTIQSKTDALYSVNMTRTLFWNSEVSLIISTISIMPPKFSTKQRKFI